MVESASKTPFHSTHVSMKMALLPSSSVNPMNHIKTQLSSMLFQYNEQLDGIPLAFSEVKFAEGKAYGRILAEHPWLHCEILSKMVIFRPAVGSWIEGQITKVQIIYI
jgi:hypothetical protein